MLNAMKHLLIYNDLHCMISFTAVQDDTLFRLLQEAHSIINKAPRCFVWV